MGRKRRIAGRGKGKGVWEGVRGREFGKGIWEGNLGRECGYKRRNGKGIGDMGRKRGITRRGFGK